MNSNCKSVWKTGRGRLAVTVMLAAVVALAGCRGRRGKKTEQPAPEPQPAATSSAPRQTDVWEVAVAPFSGGEVYTRTADGGHLFDVHVRLFDSENRAARNVPASAFSFAIDGRYGPERMAGRDRLTVEPVWMGENLSVVLVVDGASSVRMWGDSPDAYLTAWLKAFTQSLPANLWQMEILMAVGDELRGGELPPVRTADDAVARLIQLCRTDYPMAGGLTRAVTALARERSIAGNRRAALVLVSIPQRLREAEDLFAGLREAAQASWAVGVLNVGYSDPSYQPPRALPNAGAGRTPFEAGALAARELLAQATPHYRLRLWLEPARFEPDGLERTFRVKVDWAGAKGESRAMRFVVPTAWPQWASALIVAAAIVVLIILGLLVFLLVWAWRSGAASAATQPAPTPAPVAKPQNPATTVTAPTTPVSGEPNAPVLTTAFESRRPVAIAPAPGAADRRVEKKSGY